MQNNEKYSKFVTPRFPNPDAFIWSKTAQEVGSGLKKTSQVNFHARLYLFINKPVIGSGRETASAAAFLSRSTSANERRVILWISGPDKLNISVKSLKRARNRE